MARYNTCTICLALTPLGKSRCPKHLPKPRKAKTTTRGYGTQHQQLRAWYQDRMNKGNTYRCARCKTPIHTGQAWDLGHDDQDRARYTGPEHASCNRGRRKRPTPHNSATTGQLIPVDTLTQQGAQKPASAGPHA